MDSWDTFIGKRLLQLFVGNYFYNSNMKQRVLITKANLGQFRPCRYHVGNDLQLLRTVKWPS